jgi:quercetin dioxygenase-like cupin family protein
MRNYPWLFTITLSIFFLGGLNSKINASEGLFTSLVSYQPPTDLENIKVIKLSSDKNSSNFLIFIKNSVAAHRHLTHSESIYVISGEANFTLGDSTMKITQGDFIQIPEGTIHAVEVTSGSPLKVLSNQAPEFLGKDRVYVK